jgi:NhaA family Na+:H+ antiporter
VPGSLVGGVEETPMNRARRTTNSPFVRLQSPLRDFLALEAAGAILIAIGASAALVWANSPWSGSYDSLWSSRAAVTIAGHTLDLDLRHWVNEGLMTVFFFVVGLEIKRELTDGHLSTRRAALLPGAAALGGMLVPAVVYLAIAGSTAPRGWAIPVATDIALAVGVLAVAGSRVPSSLRAFLLGLAIVDDIGAIVIIAVVYSSGVAFGWLAAAAVGILLTLSVRWLGVFATWVYVVIGIGVWFSLHEAGIHPTIAGVAMGLLAPSIPRLHADLVDVEELADVSDVDAARTTSHLARSSVSVVEWLQHVLHPWTSYVIVPVFALANSGITISSNGLGDALGSPIFWGVGLGLLAGKPLGVVLATRAAIRGGLADPPEAATPRHIGGIGMAAGIGFTVALFITELALTDAVDQSNAKLGILAASVLAAVGSNVLLTMSSKRSGRRV